MPACQYYLAQSLDGYLAESDGGLDWLTKFEGVETDAAETTERSYDSFFAEVGALAMGSATYEFLLTESAERWPYPDTPSWVFSTREQPLLPGGEDVRFVSGPVRPVYDEMVAAAGERNVWIVGGGDLAMQFADEDLLDELHLTIIPVVLGQGLPVFPRRLQSLLRLAGSRTLRAGIVELRYDFVRD